MGQMTTACLQTCEMILFDLHPPSEHETFFERIVYWFETLTVLQGSKVNVPIANTASC